MKHENTSFALLTAIILAGVAAACVPASDDNDSSSGLSGLTTYIVNAGSASSDTLAPVSTDAEQLVASSLAPDA